MNRLRQARTGLMILAPVALLLLLLGYEAGTDYPHAGRSESLAGNSAVIVAGDELSGEFGREVTITGNLPGAREPMATDVPSGAVTSIARPAVITAGEVAPDQATPTLSPVIILTVEAGQNLQTIADYYATTVETIQQLNGVIDPNYLRLGQELVVPDSLQGKEWVKWPAAPVHYAHMVIGTSSNNHPIESFVFGDGAKDLVVIGGIHGGYEWNSVLLAYRFLAYFGSHPEAVPEDIRLHIIPTGNPDGIAAVTGQVGPFAAGSVSGDTTIGRPNGNGVDLNRNWGCDWSAEARWRDVPVSGGREPFSEPETRALRDYMSRPGIVAVIWLHSAAGLVIPAGCEDVSHRPSEAFAAIYGEAAGYPVGEFTAYPISGDAGNWLAQQGIASFTVELSDHQNIELDRNLSGLLALLAGIKNIEE